jgi:hypothetical protein
VADTLDLLSLPAAVKAINMGGTNTDHDAELERQITAVSRMIDAACGPVVQRTITAEIHAPTTGPIWLNYTPVVSITLVRQDWGGSITTLSPVAFGATTDGYYADVAPGGLLAGSIGRRYGGSPGSWGYGQVEVTYVAGRYATTAAVDPRFAECAASILRRLWKREAGAWSQSSEVWEGLDSQVGSGFFRVAQPIIDEMLWDQKLLPGIA